MIFTAQRIGGQPILTPGHFGDLPGGDNINGPSLIRKPDWIDGPGKYWLYFSHHVGKSIRLAVADEITGPYRLIQSGTLHLHETHFNHHIASPDVHVDEVNRRIVMYYHGCCNRDPKVPWPQISCVALSGDGIHFVSRSESLAPSYLRMFRWRGRHYGIAMPGFIFSSEDGLSDFVQGPQIIADTPRHFATLIHQDTLHLFYTRVGDCPERIVHRPVSLDEDLQRWKIGDLAEILCPERDYEGAAAERIPSEYGRVNEPSYQLRDPAIFEENGQIWLLYAVAGEYGIALAKLTIAESP